MGETPERATAITRFIDRVSDECNDLPVTVRQRLLGDLERHLQERIASGRGIELEDPVAYARDLRDAMHLDNPRPDSTPALESNKASTAETDGSAPTAHAARRPRRAVVGASALIFALAAIAIWLIARPTNQPQAPKPTGPGASISTARSQVRVPAVVGMTLNEATSTLRSVQLRAEVKYSTTGSSGSEAHTVAATEPPAGTLVLPSTVITVVIG